ncbi:hypothetical protein ACFPM3_05525 [Streptomyces coeruleoprunus]|uniref:Uncharacterized protein n=1 Tax=Streptomyces coeruleoprunus TaxID=285563 RepID=A0ABV9XCG5_9ACTN
MKTATAPSPAVPPAAKPVLPLKVNVSEVLSQDVVMAAGIHVDESSPAPLAVFRNPYTQAEDVLVVSEAGSGTALLHVSPDFTSSTGWQAVKLFDSHTPTEVVVITGKNQEGDPFVECFFLSLGSGYRSVLRSDGTWSEPFAVHVPEDGDRLRGLNVSHTVHNGHLRPLVYAGRASGSGWALHPASQPVWTRLDENARMTRVGSDHWASAAVVDGKLKVNHGVVGRLNERWDVEVPGYPQVKRVVAAFGDERQATFLILHADDTLHLWSCGPQGQPFGSCHVGDMTFRTAVAHLCETRQRGRIRWDIYGIDEKDVLWSLRQDPVRPVGDGGIPRWLPPTPLDKGIAGVAASVEPVDAPTLFSYVKGTKGLRMEFQDPHTSMWHEHDVRAPQTQAYELTHYRVEAAVTDATGAPLANYPVRLRPAEHASACTVTYQNRVMRIPREGVDLTTDACGKVTFGVAPNGLGASLLELSSADLAKPVPIQPGHAVHTYLSGHGTLRETDPGGALPKFDKHGDTLKDAQGRDNAPLAPLANKNPVLASIASQAIQRTALVGLGKKLPENAVGVRFSLGVSASRGQRTSGAPYQCVLLHNQEELDLAVADVSREEEGAEYGWLADRWNDLKHVYNEAVEGAKHLEEEARHKLRQLGGDLLRAAKNGLIEIDEAVLKGLHELSTIAVKIGNAIVKGIKVALHSLEQAAQFVANVFHQIEAFVEKVIAWLKALFDLKAIWNTKRALEEAMRKAPPAIAKATEAGRQRAATWLQGEKDNVLKSLNTVIQQLSGKKISELAAVPKGSSIGKVPQSHFTGNAHHNWLMDKMQSAGLPAVLTGLSLPQPVEPDGVEKLMQEVALRMSTAGQELEKGAKELAPAVLDTFRSSGGVSSAELAAILDGTKNILGAAFDTGTAIVDLGASLIESGMKGFGALLDAEIDNAVVKELFRWLARLSGNSDDDKPTYAGVIALVAAVPVTLIYKLAEGTDEQPFPHGRLPEASTLGTPQYRGCTLAAGILTAVQAIPMCAIDYKGDEAPQWLSLLNTLWTGAVAMLTFQGVALSEIDTWSNELKAAMGGVIAFAAYAAFLFFAQLKQGWSVLKPWMPLVMTVIGVACLGNVIRLVAQQAIDGLHTVAQSLLTFPNLFAFLNYDAIRKGPEEPLVAAVRMAIDIGGNVPGGTIIAARA